MQFLQNKYKINTPIGKGGFGTLFAGENIKTKEKIAIKKETSDIATLKHEVKMINFLYLKGVRNITEIYWYGNINDTLYMVMPLYERSLEDCIHRIIIKNWEDKVRTITSIMVQVLDILKHIHDLYIIHRDIKPANFMLKGNDIYLIDFGLATFYLNAHGEHYRPMHNIGENSVIVGSPKYASIHLHNGYVSSRRDDIISLCYMAIQLESGVWNIDIENLNNNFYMINMKSRACEYTENKVLRDFLLKAMKYGFYERPLYDFSG